MIMSAKTKFLLIQGVLAFIFVSPVDSQSVNEWRGAGRTGIYPDGSLMKSWPVSGPSLLWESLEAGTGFSRRHRD
jgi:hypothetical protein